MPIDKNSKKNKYKIEAAQSICFVSPEESMKFISSNQNSPIVGKARIIMFTLIAVLAMISLGWASDYYVATNGDDGNRGTINSPWRTIGKANAAVQPGDTVFIKAGTYHESIKPASSGAAGNPITYTNHKNDTVAITGVYDGANLTNKSYIVLDGIDIIDVSHNWVNIKGTQPSRNIIIKNCYMKTAKGWAGINALQNSYLKILNNTLIGTCACSGTPCDNGGPADLLYLDGCSYSVIKGNDISGGDHVAVNFQSHNGASDYNVIADNRIENRWHSNLSLYGDINYSLVEGNMILNAGEDAGTNWCGSTRDRENFGRENHRSIQFASSNCIIRNNVFVNNGTMPFLDFEGYSVRSNRIYNNTYHLDYKANYMYAGSDNILKNNIYSENRIYAIQGKTGNQIIKNNVYQSELMANGATISGNLSLPPEFVDPENYNFRLKQASPMINKADWLTTIVSASGAGNSFQVADAAYFVDGSRGTIEGDTIQLEGGTNTIKIIDISGNTITVDRNVSWAKGDGVSLPYSGSRPDLGAFESVNEANLLPVPQNLRIIE